MGLHARNAPSFSGTWMLCPGAIRQSEGLDEETEWAAEGTAAHLVRDRCLRTGLDARHFIGAKIKSGDWIFKVTEQWARAMQPGIDRIRDFGGLLVTEMYVDYSHWGTNIPEDQFGTLDTGVARRNMMIICDFKFGAGIPVEVEDNTQLLIYALGFYEWLKKNHPEIVSHWDDDTTVLFIIDQPRVEGGGGEHRITLGELKAFGRKLRKATAATYAEDAPLVPGLKQCREGMGCPAARFNKCPAFTKFNMDLISSEFEDLDDLGKPLPLPKVEGLTPARRCYIVKHSPMIKKWLEAVHDETLADALAGRPTPGMKAKYGRKGPRHWTNSDRVDEILDEEIGDDRFNKTLKSPTQVEETVPAHVMKRVRKFIGQSDGAPTLAPIESKGDPIPSVSSMFEDLE